MRHYSENDFSRHFRKAARKWCPSVSVFQIENRVQKGDPDYTLLRQGSAGLVELKINKTSQQGRVHVQFKGEQRNILRREFMAGNRAFLLVYSSGVAYLARGTIVDDFTPEGWIDLAALEDFSAVVVPWPQGSGPERAVRDIVRCVFG